MRKVERPPYHPDKPSEADKRNGAVSRVFDPGTMSLRLVSEAKGLEVMAERAAGLVFEIGRSLI